MKRKNQNSGSALLPVMFVIVLAAVVIGAASSLTSEQTLLSSRSVDVAALQTTGEGVLDYAYAVWKDAMNQGDILDASAANALVSGSNRPAVPSQMQIVSLLINPVDVNGVTSTSAVKAYDYKMAFVYTYVGTVTLSTSGVGGDRTVTLRRNFVYTAVPPTRGMFFSDGNFELYKPAKMFINGNVHTNGDAHVSTGTSSSNLTFLANSQVTYVGSYDNSAPPGAVGWSSSGANYVPTYATGLSSQVKKVPEITGIGLGSAAEYNTTDNNPNNDGNRELIEPPVAGYDDPPSIADSRLYNTAGLLITVSGPIDGSAAFTASGNTYTGGNLTIAAQNGTTLTAAQATQIRNAISNASLVAVQTWVPKLVQVTTQVWDSSSRKYVTHTTTVDQGKYVTTNQLVQNTIYDKRELQNIPISNLDVGAITPTLNNVSGFNGIIYMNDNGSGDQNAIRVTNGGVLPTDGLTVATNGGMYVQGDYNTGTTTKPSAVPSNSNPSSTAATTVSGYTAKSAALVADAIMVLSNGWSDSNASKSVSNRDASNTTLNTAFISGYVASVSSGDNGRSGYSGGMNNFPRLLESWDSNSLTFSGAFVSLYESKKFTGQWDTGDIYVPPTRYWTFDTMLLTRVLPGIPPTAGFVRGPMTRS